MEPVWVLLALLASRCSAAPPERVPAALAAAVERIYRSNHVEGVPLERDGDLNQDFRQEILLSADDDDVDPNDPAKLAAAIERMFAESDVDGNDELSAVELEQRIANNTEAHLRRSSKQAHDQLLVADADGDGHVSFDEYRPHFLAEETGDQHKGVDGRHVEARAGDDAARLADERRSFDAADDDKDGVLDASEWLAFLHPEHSRRGLYELVDDIVKSYDKDGDGMVSRQEFAAAPPGVVDDEVAYAKMEADEKLHREREFDDDIDVDKDGKATGSELFEYVNPRNPRQARREVAEVLQLADVDGNGGLTLRELLDRDWLIASSALISPSRRLHDEV